MSLLFSSYWKNLYSMSLSKVITAELAEKWMETHRRRDQSVAVGVQEQLRPGIGFLGEGDRVRLNGRSAESLRNYLTIINRHINCTASVQLWNDPIYGHDMVRRPDKHMLRWDRVRKLMKITIVSANVRETMRSHHRVSVTLYIYLEEPEHGEEERNDERHR